MNLPLILDIAIGLIFIYLILSLLACEIQEIITTVLQWRAVHLKKSLEILVGGDAASSDSDSVISFVNDLYNHPSIKSVNQEAKGFFTNLPRHCVWFLSSLPGKFSLSGEKRKKSIFGYTDTETENIRGNRGKSKIIKHSAPSYIPGDVFATAVIETLSIPLLLDKFTEARLIKFQEELLHEMQNILLKFHGQVNNLDNPKNKFSVDIYNDFIEIVDKNFANIIDDFQKNKADLLISLKLMAKSIDRYIQLFQENMPEYFFAGKALQELKFLRADMFDDMEQTIALKGLRPNINEVVQLITLDGDFHPGLIKEFSDKNSEAYKTFVASLQELQVSTRKLPPELIKNIANLAIRAAKKAKNSESGIYLLQQEIEQNFDKSMERATGVYRRNAKGVSILIGLAIAVIANADAGYIMHRLSKDSAVRTAIINNAGQIVQNNNLETSENLANLKRETEQVLADLALPIGWSGINLKQQIDWDNRQKNNVSIWKVFRLIFGWMVSGLAIAMGAPFWFDVLSKFMSVRNAGKRPTTTAKK